MIVQRLTRADVARCWEAAQLDRETESSWAGHTQRNPIKQNFRGRLGELAVAKWLGVEPLFKGGPDLGVDVVFDNRRLQVKSTESRTRGIMASLNRELHPCEAFILCQYPKGATDNLRAAESIPIQIVGWTLFQTFLWFCTVEKGREFKDPKTGKVRKNSDFLEFSRCSCWPMSYFHPWATSGLNR